MKQVETSVDPLLRTSMGKEIFPLTANNLECLLDYAPDSLSPTSIVSKVSLPAGSSFTHITTVSKTTLKRWSSLQVGKDVHVELNSALQYLNHSCDPALDLDTAKMELRVSQHRDLQVGDVLTFFYPSTEWNMASPFKCDCGAGAKCMVSIKGASEMDLEKLKAKGYFLNEHILALKRFEK